MPGGTRYFGTWLSQSVLSLLSTTDGNTTTGVSGVPNKTLRDGRGTQLWPDGSIYIGQWYQDRATGVGIMIHGDSGDIYSG